MGGKSKELVHIAVGVALFSLLALLLPHNVFSFEARIAVATVALMVLWWITRPVHIAVTALLPIVVTSLFNISPMQDVLADYFSPIAVLLIGANIILGCWAGSGLDKRIALKGLMVIGTSVKKQLVVWFLLSATMSAFLPNAVVAAALCPIAVAMMKFSAPGCLERGDRSALFMILLAIVWGAGIGGFGTPLGGAMNLVAIDYIEALTGREYMYVTWTVKMLPYLLVLVAGICTYLLLVKTPVKRLEGSREFFREEYNSIGRMKRSEAISLALFAVSLLLSFTRPLYEKLLPELKPYYAFLIMGVAAFFIRGEEKKSLITWDFAVKHINWGLIILFSGGMAAGNLLNSTGAIGAIAQAAAAFNETSVYLLVFAVIVLGFFLADASSNTAATAVLIPIVISIVSTFSSDPLPFVYIAAAACNCAFVLPTSIRAIPVGLGLDVRFMLKKGLGAAAISLALLSAAAFVTIILMRS